MTMASSKMESVTKLAAAKQKQAEEALNKGISGLEKNPYMKKIPTEIRRVRFLEFFSFCTATSIFTSFTYYILANSTSNSGKYSFLFKPLKWVAFISCWGSIIINVCAYMLKLQVLVLPMFLLLCSKAAVVVLILIISIWNYGIFMKVIYLAYMISLLLADLLHFRNYNILLQRLSSDDYDDNCEKIVRSVADIVWTIGYIVSMYFRYVSK